jgi:hypothetical protein
MLALFWIILSLLATCFFLLLMSFVGFEFYRRYRRSRAVICPENHRQVAVALDARHAAVTQLAGAPEFRLADCTRWPERGDCGRECLQDAVRMAEYTEGEAATAQSKPIYHLPVLIAAFAAWAIGAVWHSHYLLRSQWGAAVGLSRLEVHQLVWRLAPHFLTFAVPLLFAYGVASLLARSRKKGTIIGVADAIGLWAVIGGAALGITGLQGLSPNLLLIEISYTFVASVVTGAIIGGLSGKLVERSFAH